MKKFKDFIKIQEILNSSSSYLTHDEKIEELENLIRDYKEEQENLEQMVTNWEDEDDPMSDPGLQYEQEGKVEAIYNKIKEYSKTL